jgi:putative DNA methylase
MTAKKKLIEVALPLEAINVASAREKSIRHGHPSTLHLWWARRPLAAARAVIFAQMVDDPSAHPDIFPTEKKQEKERQRLFRIIEELVKWENTTNEAVLQQARDEIWQSWRYTCAENADHPRAKELFDRYKLPGFHDPFAGGGALPLEAQRLGLESYASDLNPVAVLINKAMIEIPPKFAGMPPVNPDVNPKTRHSGRSAAETRNPEQNLDSRLRGNDELFQREWKGAQGLAEDVRYYGQWMRDEAEKRIGHLYPKIEVTAAMAKERPDLKYVGQKLTVIAWLWARTVKSPNPAFADVDVPLASTFMLSTKAGKEAYVEPVIEGGSYRFTVKVGTPKDAEAAKAGTKLARANFACLMSGAPISGDYIKAEGKAKRMGARLMAIVAEGDRGRVYLAPTPEMEAIALTAQPTWKPEGDIPTRMTGGNCTPYGLSTWGDLFTPRQLVALTTFSDLVQEARERVKADAIAAGLPDDGLALAKVGAGATAYADAVGVYCSLAVGKFSDNASALCSWHNGAQHQKIRATFGRQALPMTWDFAEGNAFSTSTGHFMRQVDLIVEVIGNALSATASSSAQQADAQQQVLSADKLVSTDPPYYDNIGYADLSDFFYVWLRRSLKPVFPDLFATLAVPKAEELVATPYRHGSKEKAETFFLDGMTQAMHRLAEQAHADFPVTIYYAFKQAESDGGDGTTNTGWDTFLAAVIEAGFAISGTWPMRTELSNRMIGSGTNALASSIVLVCRQRASTAPTATRREFVAALKAELPQALAHLQAGNIAPVDLAQAAIGPGMAVYTRYAKVLDAEGKPIPVRAALALINQTLDEALAEQEGDFDSDSRWALAWFEQMGFNDGEFGVADVLARAKATAVDGVVEAGIAVSGKGKVRLLRPVEFPADWDPSTDKRLTVWEMVHHLIRVLEAGGEGAAAALVAKLGSRAETARELCYRLYTLCERKKRANEAMAYNGLVQSWPEITRLAREAPQSVTPGTGDLYDPT